MNRLTKRNDDGSVGISKCRYYNYEDFQKIASKLADYEDAEEQGLLLKLPCKVGDTVYEIVEEWEEMYEPNSKYYVIDKTKFDLDMFNWVGKCVFLTKEEAEQKLKEMGSD